MVDSKPEPILAPSVFVQPSIFMQRIGHVRVLLALSTGKPRSTVERLASSLSGLLTAPVDRKALRHENVQEWIKKRQQSSKYPSNDRNLVKVQLQDAYLSDPDLPSFTGTITPPTANEVVNWAMQLRLFRRDTLALSSLGETLATLDREVLGKSLAQYDPEENPYALARSDHAGLALAWALVAITADLLVLKRLLPELPIERVFDRSEAGDVLGHVLEGLIPEVRSEATIDRTKGSVASTLEGLVRALEKQRGTPSRGVREHLIAVRLEPLVDLGILGKPDPYRWQYRLDSRTAGAFPKLASNGWPSVASVVEMMGSQLTQTHNTDELWGFLHAGFVKIKSPVSFAGLGETVLAGLAEAAARGRFYEWSTGRTLITSAQKLAPRDVRFNVDRYGEVRHIRLPADPPEGLANVGTATEGVE
jgi:hypothetical protein